MKGKHTQTKYLALSAMFGALLCLCSWISIPTGSISFTLQTFAVALALLTLGGKWGSGSIAVFLTLGAVGLPVFSGFQGGLGILFGPSGGYLFGFMLTGLLYWLMTFCVRTGAGRLLGLAVGIIACWILGWLRLRSFTPVSFWAATLPFVIPDLLKISLAWFLSRRLRRI